MADRIMLSIGTKKGVFVAESSARRSRFSLKGPYGQGVAVYTTLIDARRAAPRIFASSCNAFFGMKLLVSTNLGSKFKETKSPPAFPKQDGREHLVVGTWQRKTRTLVWCATRRLVSQPGRGR